MTKVVLITGHYYGSKRRAGFHWLADAMWKAGADVTFMTVALSRLSRLRGDHRLRYPVLRDANRIRTVRDRLDSFVWHTPWHPANLRLGLFNRLSAPLFRRYGSLPLGDAEDRIRTADLFVFESTPGLLLFERFKSLNPSARYVYRVSDDLRLLKPHPVVIEAERRVAPRFDLVSTPSAYIHDRFRSLPGAALQYHGIEKTIFDRAYDSPYGEAADGVNAVFVGNAYLDTEFLRAAARICPDWRFHIIGNLKALPNAMNILRYGEMPFAETVKFIQHADLGLATLAWKKGAESFSDSLKVLQYTYCKLPIVVPEFMVNPARTHMFAYTPGKADSIKRALLAAAEHDRATIDTSGVTSWDELAERLRGT